MRFFFDTRDDENLIEDEEGIELPDLQAAKFMAAESLAEIARDVIPGATRRILAVEVRDEAGPVMRTTLIFESAILRPT